MSKIGKHPVQLPEGVSAEVKENEVVVKGKMGELKTHIPAGIQVTLDNNHLVVKPIHETKEAEAFWGTMRANLANMVKGVSAGFSTKLELVGVGYRAQVQGQKLVLTLGFSHDITYQLPVGVKAECADQTKLTLSSANKQLLGQVAAEIRSYRRPEPYKGKGIKYAGEHILRKEGKKK